MIVAAFQIDSFIVGRKEIGVEAQRLIAAAAPLIPPQCQSVDNQPSAGPPTNSFARRSSYHCCDRDEHVVTACRCFIVSPISASSPSWAVTVSTVWSRFLYEETNAFWSRSLVSQFAALTLLFSVNTLRPHFYLVRVPRMVWTSNLRIA